MSKNTGPDYSKYTTIEEIDGELEVHFAELHRLLKRQETEKQAKKDMAAGFKEVLSEIQERIDEQMETIDGFHAQRDLYK